MPVTADNMVEKANVQTAASFATKCYPAPVNPPSSEWECRVASK